MAKGIEYYAPNSVIILMKYLAKKHLNDIKYISTLQYVINKCGTIYFTNKLNMANQTQVALEICSSKN